MNRILGLLLFCVVISLSFSNGSADTRVEGQKFYDPLIHTHLVLRGTVESVSYDHLPYKIWDDRATLLANDQIEIFKTVVSVEGVMKGAYDNKKITLILFRNNSEFIKPGSSFIFCAEYNPRFNNGCYFVRCEDNLYALEDGYWIQQFTKERLTLNDINNRISATKLGYISREAGLIVTGTIVSMNRSKIRGPEGRHGGIQEFDFQIDSVLKGDEPNQNITFKMITTGLYSPPWRTYIPFKYKEGEQWLVFLKKGEIGYYPFAGSNGLFKMENGKLIYDLQVEYQYNKKEIAELITKELSNER